MKNLLSDAYFSVIFVLLLLSFLIFLGCTATEPKNAEGEFVRHNYYKPIETNSDKVVDEIIYKSKDFTLHKVTINDTIVSYFAYEYHTGFVKLNWLLTFFNKELYGF